VLTGAAAYYLFDLAWLESVLLGAVVASTDAAAVFATLRYTHIRRRVARTLEAETGLNDPVAIALTIGLIAWIEESDFDLPDLVLSVTRQLGIGLAVGVALAAVAVWVFARLPHSIGAFAPVASVAAGALSFGAGLRCAVPIVLATFVLSSDVGDAETIFNAVFFVVVVSALVQGTTLEWVAERLGLVDPRPEVRAAPLEVDALGSLELVEFDVAGDHAIAGSLVRELGLPRSALVALVARGRDTIPPRGGTLIEAGDRLFVLVPRENRPELKDVFERWRRRV
jgi:cell volume regulation protein A